MSSVTVEPAPAELPSDVPDQPPASPQGSWWRPAGRPAWARPAQAALALVALVLYTWDLSRVGMGNTFYSAAVKSGTESWKAFFFGSLDRASFITVDKPPASLWVQELSARVFGFSSWSILLPEALAGVASVLVVHHLVRRWQGEVPAVLAGLAFALTPVAVVMFRYNNPDALLTLLLLLAAWALFAALETGATWRLVACGALLGLAFTTKTLQAFVVLPGFGLAYLWCGPGRLGRRTVQLLWGGLALIVASAWWVAIVELWPAASRPYLGGSTDNSELNLIFGYNGFGRIFGGSGGGIGGAGGPTFAGSPGLLRMANDIMGGQIAWLLPLAMLGLVAGLVATLRARRDDLGRAGFVLWGGWAVVTLLVFSEAQGIFHPYYTVALAPALAALAAGGSAVLWRQGRRSRLVALILPLAVLGSAVWAAVLLARTPGYASGLGLVLVVAGAVAALGLALALTGLVRWPALAVGSGALAAATLLGGPLAYAVTTIGQATTGGDPTAGPATAAGGLGGFAAPGGRTFPGGAVPGAGAPSGGIAGLARGLGGGGTADAGLLHFLEAHRHGATWLMAVSGSQTAAPYILASGQPIMAMGGFTSSDPAPTLAQFKQLVAEGKVRYVLVGGGLGGFGGGGSGFSGFPGPAGGFEGLPGAPGGARGGGFAGPGPSGARGGFPGAAGGAPGGGGGTVSAVEAWVKAHGTVVPSSAYGGSAAGTLYLVTPASVR